MSRRFSMIAASAALLAASLAAIAPARALQAQSLRPGSAPDGDRTVRQLLAEAAQPVESISVDIRPPADGDLPQDRSQGLFSSSVHAPPDMGRCGAWREKRFEWTASALYHQPLYFEQIPLEYYGQSRHPLVQPWLSGVHFFGNFALIPYKIGLDHPYCRVYQLGYYRPGSPAPCVCQRLPLQWDAAALEAGTWLALIFALP